MSDIHLCSFASPDLNPSVKRFIDQSQKMEIYASVKIFGYKDLTKKKKNQINKFLENKKRLFGYACWKPDIILSCLNKIPKNSILQYSDIGCHLNKKGIKRLIKYKNLTIKKNILAFQYYLPKYQKNKKLKYQIYYEKQFTKNDLFEYLGISINSKIRNTEQFWSGSIFFKNNQYTIKFLKSWMDICNKSHLIDDTPSKTKNDHNFIEHRHDQSAFSLLCKLNRIYSLSASECEWAENIHGRYWSHLNLYPILAKRDKKKFFLKRFFDRQFKKIKRIFN